MDPIISSRHRLVPMLMIFSIVFCTGCPWGGDGAKVKAAKAAFESYQREVAQISSDPQNASQHHNRAFAFVLQAQQHAQAAISGRERGTDSLNIGSITAAVESARLGRFNHFTRLAEEFINRGDRNIVEDPANPGQPANPRAARENYEQAQAQAELVENRSILRSIMERLNLRPLRASIVADKVDELARAQQQALLLATRIKDGTQDPHGYDRDWSESIPNWNFSSLEAKQRNIQALIGTLSQEIRTGIGELSSGSARQGLENQMTNLTQAYTQALASAQSQAPDAFWTAWERSRPEFERARDGLSGAVRDFSTRRVASPSRVEQPIAPIGPTQAARSAAASSTQPIVDADDVRITAP